MKLSNIIIDLGRVVAYYPSLKIITKSTTSTILLCQILYWTPRSQDKGWVWKTDFQIGEETGLTTDEIKGAKKRLKDSGLLTIEFKRLDRMSRYKVNTELLNKMWEEATGKQSEVVEDFQMLDGQKYVSKPIPGIVDSVPKELNSTEKSEKAKKEKLEQIKDKIEKRLRIIADGRKWNAFIDLAYDREKRYNQSIDVFLTWVLENDYNPMFMPPDKLRTLYPQAFIDREPIHKIDNFVPKLPEYKEEKFVPMPRTKRQKQ